ncbi:MAG: FAD-dependent monooxygenase [Clostridiales bacterium]|nr:FAD-dependent monooxygenase [Clostridiales bacterium]
MIRISQLKLPVEHTEEDLRRKVAKLLRISADEIRALHIRRRSLDARKKPVLFYSYLVDVEAAHESAVVKKAKNLQITLPKDPTYRFPACGDRQLKNPPLIVGAGPAGLFAGLLLARHGYCPVILERGEDVDSRTEKVSRFWRNGILDTHTNVQFGEGGAGTFSDGKLNTLVKDPCGRNRLVLETFCAFGADAEILYEQKPHLGTDVLAGIVRSMREEIIRLGGTVRFGCQVTDLLTEEGRIQGVIVESQARAGSVCRNRRGTSEACADGREIIPAQAVILAIGHSARDTFQMLANHGVLMDAKAFAVGLRIQHPQSMINRSQYGREDAGMLGAASYRLTRQTSGGRGVYSFCMCPGGYVVNASSEEGRLAVNGMSYHNRAGINANSALIVTVTPEDYPDQTPLGGVAFQRELEERAFAAASGSIPVQLYDDFRNNRVSRMVGDVEPQMQGAWAFADVRSIMPETLNRALLEAMEQFGRVIDGFDRPDAVLAGIESRTSSPVRIWRNEQLESPLRGLFPCGEGAGYAGGITSAAMDGVKVAEAVAAQYRPLQPVGLPERIYD